MEIEPLRNVGVALSAATLQQTLYSLGYEESVSDLDEATKAQLRYIQILRSSTEWQTDMGRTLVSPANAIRVLKEQFSQLGVAIGQVFLPPLMAAIPYIMVITEALTNLAKKMAKLFGYEITPTATDPSTYSTISNGIASIGDEAEDTTKKLNTMLAPFDELNVVQKENDKNKKKKKDNGAGVSLDLPIDGYDALANLNNKFAKNLDKARENLKKILPIVLAIAGGFAAWKISRAILDEIIRIGNASDIIHRTLGKIGNTIKGIGLKQLALNLAEVGSAVIGIVTALTSGKGLYQISKQIGLGLRDANKSAKDLTITGLGFAASISLIAGALTGFNPIAMLIGAGLGSIGAGLLMIKGEMDGVREKVKGDIFGDFTISTDSFLNALNKTNQSWSNTYKVIEDYKESLSSLNDSFDESTNHVGTYLYQMKLLGDGVDEDTRARFETSMTDFFNSANALVDENTKYTTDLLTASWKDNANITDESQKEILGIIQDNNNYVKTEIADAQDQYNQIVKNAMDTRGYLTAEEYNTIKQNMDKIHELINSQASQSQTDMEYYINQANTKGLELSEEGYKNYKAARDKYAEEQKNQIAEVYNETANELDKQIKVTQQRMAEAQKQGNTEEYNRLDKALTELQTARKQADDDRMSQEKDLQKKLKENDDVIYADLKKHYEDTYKLSDTEGKKQRKAMKELFKDLKVPEDFTKSIDKAHEKVRKSTKETTISVKKDWSDTLTGIKPLVDTTDFGFDDLKNRVFSKWDEIKSKTSTTWENIKTTIGTSISGTKDDLSEKLTEIKEGVSGKWDELSGKTSDTWDNIKAKITTSTDEFKNSVGSGVQNIKDTVSDRWDKTKTNSTETWEYIKKTIGDKWGDMKSGADSIFTKIKSIVIDEWAGAKIGLLGNIGDKNFWTNRFGSILDGAKDVLGRLSGLFNSWQGKLKTPHLEWKDDGPKASGMIKKMLETFSLPTTLPMLHVKWYETGGFPKSGELFGANENGVPEMIGKIGNRSAVVNNEQIANVLTNTLITALDSYQGNSQPAQTTIYIGSKKVYEGYGDYVNDENDRYGTNMIRI